MSLQFYDWCRAIGQLARRRFWSLVLATGVAVLLLSQNTPSQAQLRPEIRGVWVTANDTDIFRDRAKSQAAISELARLNFNTIYPVVWNSGYVMYPSAVARQAGIPFVHGGFQGQDVLTELVSQAHRQGLLLIPWFEFGLMTPPTSELALAHPDWLTAKRNGDQTSNGDTGEVVWLNPVHPEVQKFITDLVVEIVVQHDADGIQFDDHMSLPYEFGYDHYTAALYKKETKKEPPANPKDEIWMRWRANKITALMTQINQAVKVRKPTAFFAISPNYYDFAYKFHLQDWLAWVRQGIVDELVVQVYRSDRQSFFDQITRPEIQEAQQKIVTGIGILAGLRNNRVPMARIRDQVQLARDRGLGLSFFYYESLWAGQKESAPDRISGFQALFAAPAPRSPLVPPVIAAPTPTPKPLPKPEERS
jgi:uncharacterized lipoprotein YddW (UPF0748 family)